MKYISTLHKTPNSNTIRIFLDLNKRIFVIKVKENNYTATYDARSYCFIDVNFVDLTWIEHTLIHTYFYINKTEINRILEETNENSIDFIEHNLKVPDVNYDDPNCVFELTNLLSNKKRGCN